MPPHANSSGGFVAFTFSHSRSHDSNKTTMERDSGEEKVFIVIVAFHFGAIFKEMRNSHVKFHFSGHIINRKSGIVCVLPVFATTICAKCRPYFWQHFLNSEFLQLIFYTPLTLFRYWIILYSVNLMLFNII